jgi:adenylate kinase family enzyme
MTRVAIIGNAGGGKSTLSRRLGVTLDLPVYPIDQIQWKPGWIHASSTEFQRQHDRLLALDHWIIDGWGPWNAIQARFEAADTIIVVDHPLVVHYWWAFKRQWMCLFRPRPDGPPGCPMLPMTWPLLKMIWSIHRTARPQLLQLVSTFRDHKHVVHLRSPRELRQFAQIYC